MALSSISQIYRTFLSHHHQESESTTIRPTASQLLADQMSRYLTEFLVCLLLFSHFANASTEKEKAETTYEEVHDLLTDPGVDFAFIVIQTLQVRKQDWNYSKAESYIKG